MVSISFKHIMFILAVIMCNINEDILRLCISSILVAGWVVGVCV